MPIHDLYRCSPEMPGKSCGAHSRFLLGLRHPAEAGRNLTHTVDPKSLGISRIRSRRAPWLLKFILDLHPLIHYIGKAHGIDCAESITPMILNDFENLGYPLKAGHIWFTVM